MSTTWFVYPRSADPIQISRSIASTPSERRNNCVSGDLLMMKIQKLDAWTLIRKLPKMYVGTETVTGSGLLCILADEVALDVGDCVTCSENGRLFRLESAKDWLGDLGDSEVVSVFSKIASRVGEVNSFRAEVLIGAFASSIATKRPGQPALVIKDEDGEGLGLAKLLNESSSVGRVLVFLFQGASSEHPRI